MKKFIRKNLILLFIFIAAILAYFGVSLLKSEEDSAVYTSIEDANLPLAHMEIFGRRMNALCRFVVNLHRSAGRADLTLLTPHRQLL